MPIKKSALEKKWYYRIAKVFFLLLPVPAAIYLLSNSGISVPEITQQNVSQIFQENAGAIIIAVVSLVAYYIILGIVWKISAYIIFGGVENDTRTGHASGQTAAIRTGTQTALSGEDQKQIGFYLFLLFIIGVIYYAYFVWKPDNIDIFHNGGKNGKCISTGCGTQWYCAGTYYDENGSQKRINGCLPKKANETYSSWSGICRQCP